jgi:hypothetical protein
VLPFYTESFYSQTQRYTRDLAQGKYYKKKKNFSFQLQKCSNSEQKILLANYLKKHANVVGGFIGSVTIRATQWKINASYNQRQRFFHLSPEPYML